MRSAVMLALVGTAAACRCAATRSRRTLWKDMLNKIQVATPNEQANVNLLCVVKTHSGEHKTRTRRVADTWAPRCNKTIFVSNQEDPAIANIRVLKLHGKEEWNNLWEKTRRIFKLLATPEFAEYAWVFYCDTDTYTIVENLRALIFRYHAIKRPVYAGHRLKFNGNVGTIYNSGGAGTLLNRAAVLKVSEGRGDECTKVAQTFEDVQLGKCLASMGVVPEITVTPAGHYFHMFAFGKMYTGGLPPWTRAYSFPVRNGTKCCNAGSATFHYMTTREFLDLDCLLYSCSSSR